MGFFTWAGIVIVGIVAGKILFDQIVVILKKRELKEIDDCPFKFTLKGDDNLVVQLTKETTLWCDYGFGIRSDGIYGIDQLRLIGINGPQSEIRHLKVGQSVFPIISAMDQFISWVKLKPFKTEFKDGFYQEWNAMKKNLDNLRILESELSKKEKKSK